jgi:aminopeptidase N
VEIDSISSRFFLNHFSTLTDDLLRASVLTDLTENLHEGKINCSDYLNMLIAQLPQEPNTVIFERELSYLEWSYLYKASREEQQLIQEKLENTTWGEYTKRKNQQTAIINSIMRMVKTESSLTKLLESLDSPASHPEIKLSADQQNELAYQLALKMPEKATVILDNQEKRISNPDKKAQFQFVRQSLNQDKNERDKFFQSLLQEENREHEPWVDQSLAFLNHPSNQKEALKYLRPALDELQEIQRTGDIFFPKSWLDNLLKGHNSEEAAAIVRQFLADHPDYPENLRMKILQSSDHLMRK